MPGSTSTSAPDVCDHTRESRASAAAGSSSFSTYDAVTRSNGPSGVARAASPRRHSARRTAADCEVAAAAAAIRSIPSTASMAVTRWSEPPNADPAAQTADPSPVPRSSCEMGAKPVRSSSSSATATAA